MRMLTRRIWILFALFALALTLAACGGGDDPTPTPVPPTPTPEAAAPQGDVASGAQVYQSSCVACHGPDAYGVQGLGKSMHPNDSDFIRKSTDEDLVQMILQGRTPDHPLNTTGVGMPAKGGNPALSEQQIWDVVAWMRTLE